MHPGKLKRRLIRGDRNAEIAKRIKGRLTSESSTRLKDRIGLVKDTIKARSGYLLAGLDVL